MNFRERTFGRSPALIEFLRLACPDPYANYKEWPQTPLPLWNAMTGSPTKGRASYKGPMAYSRVKQFHRDWLEAGPYVPPSEWPRGAPRAWPSHVTPAVLHSSWQTEYRSEISEGLQHLAAYVSNHPRAQPALVIKGMEEMLNQVGFLVWAFNIPDSALGFFPTPMHPKRRNTWAKAMVLRATDPLNIAGPMIETFAFGAIPGDVFDLPTRPFDPGRTKAPDLTLPLNYWRS